MEYPWYTILSNTDELLQGDIVPECPILIPPPFIIIDDELKIDIQFIDSIVLSQSCDLANNHLEIVLVCPYYSLITFIESIPSDQSSTKKSINKTIENLRKGYLPGYHLLNRFNGHLDDYQVVDFRNVYGIHIGPLKEICKGRKNRIRLLPPYREHLSQAFARYFMRVGLPQDISIVGY